MNIHEYRFLLSERATLNKLIRETEQSDVIGRMSFEARLQEVQEQLEEYEGFSSRLVNASLTFRGSPVVGSRGIDATFGTNAARSFSDAVGLVGASKHAPLSSAGPIPHREDYRLIITNTARGSFGFQFEEASQQPALPGESTPVETAIARVKEILEASVGTDEELAEAIAETDQRALGGIRNFLKTVADNDAVCALAFHDDVFKFVDVAQVRRSENRLSEDNIKEDDVTLTGEFLGFFPRSPRAQFRIESAEADFMHSEVGETRVGQVEASLADAVDINDILNEMVRIDAHTRRVGSGRPRYVITHCELLTL